eukprot:Skav225488  [mRNA]  locus=scaffold868:67474:68202:- [translate_table: standard]
MATDACQWRTSWERDVKRAYQDKERWHDVDRVTDKHNYSFRTIEEWPLDAAVIYQPTDGACVMLGSLKGACSLEEISSTLSVEVTVVVTMCAQEMKIRGAPTDWSEYFRRQNIFHVTCQLEDTTLKPPQRWTERIPSLVDDCLEQWKMVCCQLWKHSITAVMESRCMNVLFHCFGGINRSAGVLCAWLIIGYNFTKDDAVRMLLEKRPSLRPWHNRPYVLEALYKLETLRAEWHAEFVAPNS